MRDAVCDLFSRCLSPISLEDCRRIADFNFFDEPLFVSLARFREAVEVGTILFHPDQVADCVTRLTEVTCPGLEDIDRILDVCPIFSGTVIDGSPCMNSVECATPGAVCGGAAACSEGDICCLYSCLPPAGIGQSCVDVGCEPGAHCNGSICLSGDIGSLCDFDFECDPALWCDTGTDPGTCRDAVRPGAACTSDNECPQPETCLGNALTGSDSGNCGRSDREGDACDGFCYGLECVQPDSSAFGTCRPLAGDGESCAEVSCGQSSDCSADELCVRKGDIGAVCTDGFNDCLPGLFCDNEIDGGATGSCTAAQESEATCTSSSHCASSICGVAGTCEDFPGCYP